MQDVAQLAGVSVKTVSNVLSGYEHVSVKMRDRVMVAVGALDYEINVSARNLRVGRTRVIGLAVPELSQAYFAELADAVIRAASARGYTVLIEQTAAGPSAEISAIAAMRKHSIDALIYCPLTLVAGDAEQLDVDFPLVVLGERVEGSNADHVTMSNEGAIRAVTEHLLDQGCHHVAVLGAHPDGPVGTGASRLRGFTSALHARGIEVDQRLVLTAPLWHRTYGVEAMELLIASGVPFDGVVCFNDALALGAMRALQRNGLRIPQDVMVTGFDDIEDSAYSTPSLTTVSPGREQIAHAAVDLVVDSLEGSRIITHPQEIETGFDLVLRESTVADLLP